MLKDVVSELYGLSSFVKIRNDYFAIGQVLFSFVKRERDKDNLSIECCLTTGEALEFALSVIQGKIRVENADSDGYIWKSDIGGVHEEDAHRKGMRKDGLAVARWFGIQTSNVGWARFTATQTGGNTNEKGLIIPLARSTREYINVSIPSEAKLRSMAMEIMVNIIAYQSTLYGLGWETLEAQRAEYRKAAKEKAEKFGMSNSSKNKEKSEPEIRVIDGYFRKDRGSIMERRGNGGNAAVLRMVVPKVSDKEPAILPTDDGWQLADIVFYENVLKGASEPVSEQLREVIAKAEADFDKLYVKGITVEIGEILNGYRQLIFKAKQ